MEVSNEQDFNKKMPTLSCCMIVKNEEKFLTQCLKSIKDVVDEIIIVDTGSTDNTVEIAKRFTDKVYFHEWQNSFSEARNYSLKFAKCDWILQIDADEELVQEDIPLLCRTLETVNEKEDINAIFVALYNVLSSGESKHYFQRIFRRGKAHYEGIVHNQLVYEGKAVATEIRFRHYGYNLSADDMEKKHERTKQLLIQQIKEDPANGFARMNLVRIYRNQKLFDKAIEEAQTALETSPLKITPDHRQMIKCDMANCMIQLSRFDEAEKICLEVIEKNPENLDIIFTLALIYQMTERYQEAISRYRQFLMTHRDEIRHTRFNLLIVDTYTSSDRAWNNMGICHHKLGQMDEAINAYQQAIEENPETNVFYINLAHAYIQQNDVNEAKTVLKKAIELGIADDKLYLLLGDVYFRNAEFDQALTIYQKIIELNPGNISVYNRLGKTLIKEGDLGKAENQLEHLKKISPQLGERRDIDSLLIDSLFDLAKIKISTKKREDALEIIEQISEYDDLDKKLYLDLSNLCIRLEEYEKAINLLESYLKYNPNDHIALTNLASCYAKMKNYESAIIGYKAALNMNPNNIQAIQNLKALEQIIQSETDSE